MKFLYNNNTPEIVLQRKIILFVQVLTGEDWNVVMYDGIQAYDGVKVVLSPNMFSLWLNDP